MNNFDNSYRIISLHVTAASPIMMMILDFMSFSFDGFLWLPEMTALTLLYQTLHQPQRAGMGLVSAIGLIVDVATATTLGLHALSYVMTIYSILNRRRQTTLYGHIMQSAAVLAMLLLNQVVLTAAYLFLNCQVIILQGLVAPSVGALFWPILSQLMLIATCIYRTRWKDEIDSSTPSFR